MDLQQFGPALRDVIQQLYRFQAVVASTGSLNSPGAQYTVPISNGDGTATWGKITNNSVDFSAGLSSGPITCTGNVIANQANVSPSILGLDVDPLFPTANALYMGVTPSADNYALWVQGDGTAAPATDLFINAPTVGQSIVFSIANTDYVARFDATMLTFFPTVTAPTVRQLSASGATPGETLTVQAQNSNTTGGKLALTSGGGGVTPGAVEVQIAGAAVITIDGPSPSLIHLGRDANTTQVAVRINGKTQSTVGAAGGAAALPATPSLYVNFQSNGVEYVLPAYLP